MLSYLLGADSTPLDSRPPLNEALHMHTNGAGRSRCHIRQEWSVAVPDGHGRGTGTCKMSPQGANGSDVNRRIDERGLGSNSTRLRQFPAGMAASISPRATFNRYLSAMMVGSDATHRLPTPPRSQCLLSQVRLHCLMLATSDIIHINVYLSC